VFMRVQRCFRSSPSALSGGLSTGFVGFLQLFTGFTPICPVFSTSSGLRVVIQLLETRSKFVVMAGESMEMCRFGDGLIGPVAVRTRAAWPRSEDRTFAGGGKGLIEQVDDGGGEAEAVDDLCHKGGAGGVFGGKGRGDAPLAAEDEVDGRIVREEAFGRAGEGLTVDGLHEFAKAGGGEETAELGVAADARVGEVAADSEELVAFGHVDTGGDGNLRRVDVKVEAASRGFFEAGAGPPGGGMCFVGAFVLGEADVAVDAHQGLLRRANVGRSEAEHGLVDLGDDGEHRLFDLPLEDVAACFKPDTVVVTLEAAEEFEGGEGEMGRHGVMLAGQRDGEGPAGQRVGGTALARRRSGGIGCGRSTGRYRCDSWSAQIC